ADATYAVTATSTDTAGNASSASSAFNVTVDTTAPGAPTVVTQTTADLTPTITGTATVGSGETLTVVVSGATYTVTPSGTAWSLDLGTATPTSGSLTALANGNTYHVTATVTDTAGNATSDSTSSELVIDTTDDSPTIIVDGDQTVSTFGLEDGVDAEASDGTDDFVLDNNSSSVPDIYIDAWDAKGDGKAKWKSGKGIEIKDDESGITINFVSELDVDGKDYSHAGAETINGGSVRFYNDDADDAGSNPNIDDIVIGATNDGGTTYEDITSVVITLSNGTTTVYTQDFGSLGGSSLAIDFKSDGRVNIEELPSDATVVVYTASGYTALVIDNDADDKIYVSDVGIGHSTSASIDSNIDVDASATAFTYTYTSGGSSLDGQTIVGTGSTTLQSGGANLVFDVLEDGVIAGVKTAVGGDVVFTLTPVITGTDVIYRLDMFDVIDDPDGASAIGYLFDIDISIVETVSGVDNTVTGGITVGFDQLGTDTTSTSQDGDTTLVASYEAETLIAGTGTDTFQWELADGDATGDVVTDYTRGTDVIDIGDLLSTGIADGDLDEYINVSSDGTDTVIRISSTGDFSDGYQAGSDNVDQVITVSGVDLTNGDTLDTGELTELLKSLYTGIVDPNGP
ncbi:MAG: type I secretion C-terminal target domain-containing protein, partial [Gammaproteobacteria bacterium]|nr:type I secretion C-terminal target domain-containing protein [Gammaproteobacteria bacterium]